MSDLIEITLDGQKYRLRADEKAELIKEAAKLVNEQLDEVRQGTKTSSPFQVALLGALNLALRLKKTSKDVEDFKKQTSHEIHTISELLEEEIKSIQPVLGGTA